MRTFSQLPSRMHAIGMIFRNEVIWAGQLQRHDQAKHQMLATARWRH